MSEAAMAPIVAPEVITPVESNTQESVESTAPKQETLKAAQKPEYYDVKVDKGIRRYTLEELKAKASLAEAANERFQQAAEINKRFGSLKQKVQQDPIGALLDKDLGLTEDQVRDVFEKWYHKKYVQPETLSEPERRAMTLAEEKSRLEEELRAHREEKERYAFQQKESHAINTAQQEIVQLMEANKLPKTPAMVKRIAYWKMHNIKNGWNAPDEVIVQQLRDEDKQLLQERLVDTDIDYLLQIGGEKLLNKLRKYDMEQLQKKLNPQPVSTPQPISKQQSKGSVRPRDVERYLADIRRSK